MPTTAPFVVEVQSRVKFTQLSTFVVGQMLTDEVNSDSQVQVGCEYPSPDKAERDSDEDANLVHE